MDFGSLQQAQGIGRDGNDSSNWPVLLVRKKKTLLISPELDAAWFGGGPRAALVDSGEHVPFQVVSRRRLRLAHAVFLLAFGAVLALLFWEVRIHLASGSNPAANHGMR